jgi:hypothetical protein
VSVQGMEEKYNFSINAYVDEKREKDNRLHRWVIVLLILFGVLLCIHMIFDYHNEEQRKRRADANQVEFEKSLKLIGIDYKYSDTLTIKRPEQ